MSPVLTSAAFLSTQLLLIPFFLLITKKCTNLNSKKYTALFIITSPFAVYLYVTFLFTLIGTRVENRIILIEIASLSDVILILISLAFAYIYTRICNKLSKWYPTYYFTIYLLFVLLHMSFNWTYDSAISIILFNIVTPLLTMFYFLKAIYPKILNIKNHPFQTKPTNTLAVLALLCAVFFLLRSFVVMAINMNGMDFATSTNVVNIYMTAFTYLILAFLFTGLTTMLANIQNSQDIKQQAKLNSQLTNDMIMALVKAIDIKDKYTTGHSHRVANYAKMIAEKIYDNPDKINEIYQIALLHDIGKLGVPDDIINKPGKLTEEEYEIIKSHTIKGYEILSEITSLPDIIYGAKYHHERYDGKGYPQGIAGEQIPEIAALIAVADAYDAMTSKRSYKDVMSQDTVRQEIKNNIGKQFNPKFAKIMLNIIDADTNYELHQ